MTAASTPPLPLLDAAALRQLATQATAPGTPGATGCDACAPLVCPGWESMPGDYDRHQLQRVATLRDPADEDPTLDEHHPAGTHAWSPDAPIAPGWFPYNRCEVWRCTGCGRPFLRYTEYGGYYEDERIRAVDAGLVVEGKR